MEEYLVMHSTKNRAKSKLLKGAKKPNLDVEVKDGCVNLRFCDGSFHEIILPLLNLWQQRTNEVFKIDEVELKVIEVIKGTENTKKHVDTKLILMVNDDRLVVHVYNGTHNMMIQGKNYDKVALSCLEPFFRKQIEISKDKISKVNNDIINCLDPKKAINRKPFDCPQCRVKATTVGDLRIHMKKCHSKPSLESPKRRKAIKFNVSDMKMIEMVPNPDDTFADEVSHEKNKSGDDIEITQVVPFMPEVPDLLICSTCDYDTTEQEDLDNHLTSIHGLKLMEKVVSVKQQVKLETQEKSPQVTAIICGECAETFVNENDCNTHMKTHAVSPNIKCVKCDYTSQSKVDVDIHIQSVHMSLLVDLKESDQNSIKCDQCDYRCKYNMQLKKHMKKHISPAKYKCKECEFSTEFVASAWEHKVTDHPDEADNISPKESENIALKIVAEQTTSISEDMDLLKRDTKNALAEIMEAINNMKNENNEKCKMLGNTVVKLVNKISRIEKALPDKHPHSNDKPKTKVDEKLESKRSKTSKTSRSAKEPETKKPQSYIPPSPPQVPRKSEPQTKPSMPKEPIVKKTSFLKKPKVLYVGDSVGHTANLRLVEIASNCRISTANAFSSVQDGNSLWPDTSFAKVVKENLQSQTNDDYEILVMSSPTVDISNLNTNLPPNMSTENLEEKAILSSRNMFNTAQEALSMNCNLKKVIIMEHPPRFDDPLKSKLAELANTTLSQLWAISPQNNRIFIGRHSLVNPGSGSMHLARYKDHFTGRYDGVHLYGRRGVKDYTDSVKSALMMTLSEQYPSFVSADAEPGNPSSAADHTRCEQAMYQWRQVLRRGGNTVQNRYGTHIQDSRGGYTQTQWSIPTENRFSFFNQGN